MRPIGRHVSMGLSRIESTHEETLPGQPASCRPRCARGDCADPAARLHWGRQHLAHGAFMCQRRNTRTPSISPLGVTAIHSGPTSGPAECPAHPLRACLL